MRLIDADRLMDNLRGNVLIDVTPELEDTIAQQPTAFDRQKVIEKIKRERDEAQDYNQYSAIAAHEIDIDIVEKGGNE